MKIVDFNIKKGVYSFEFNHLNTEVHSHPAVEIINATQGTFSMEVNGKITKDLVFALIDANVKHRLLSQNCTIQLLMVESHNPKLSHFLQSHSIVCNQGAFLKSTFAAKDDLFLAINTLTSTEDLKTPTDPRIRDSIAFMATNQLEYKTLISDLTSKVHLSDSRLSHLFKEHIGVSIKKYLVWNRLRQAMSLYLNGNTNLTEVSLQSGFFDQAHLSNAFKNVFRG